MNNLIKLIAKNSIAIVLAAAVAYMSSNLPLSIYFILSGGCAIPIDSIGLPKDYQWPLCFTILIRYHLLMQIFSGLVLFVTYYLILRALIRRLIK